jgi:DNA replication protein DnaC
MEGKMETKTNIGGLTMADRPQHNNPPPNKTCKCGTVIEPIWFEETKVGDIDRPGFWVPAAELCDDCQTKANIIPDQTIEERMIIAGVPKPYLKMQFGNYKCEQENEKSLLVLEDYIRHPDGGIFISGNCGLGKTHLAVALTRNLIMLNKLVHFDVVPELLLKIKSEIFEKNNISEEDVVNQYARYDYLILDDLGAEKVTGWTLQTLYLIFDRRLREGKTNIIITSNLSLPKIEDELSERISSRIAGMCRIVKFTGDDWRLKRK